MGWNHPPRLLPLQWNLLITVPVFLMYHTELHRRFYLDSKSPTCRTHCQSNVQTSHRVFILRNHTKGKLHQLLLMHSCQFHGFENKPKTLGHSPVIEEPFVVPTTWLTETYIKSGGQSKNGETSWRFESNVSGFRNHSNDDQFWLFQFFVGGAL